ncbi:MAG TPA: toll/interleukin-1 receptor domain-containing protein [Verrucomicrobiae bacterium]|nr:toll/interleukin-1 receptor domain-containing protein [Verrucomicrobiae bacterium]
MANPEHLAILKQGTDIWNRWRAEHRVLAPDLINAELDDLYLADAQLTTANCLGAKLRGATLVCADLHSACLVGADLSEANLIHADLAGADLCCANLTEANLAHAHLDRTVLAEAKLVRTHLARATISDVLFGSADLTDAIMEFTLIAGCNISGVRGLETVKHHGPSSIGIDTLYESEGRIPDKFLRESGIPEDVIQHLLPLIRAGKAIQFYTCFISYCTKDQAFADRLYADLQAKRVRCWLFTEDAKWGETVWGEIDRGIKLYGKLVVICSEHSLQSPAVLREIERALQREDREKKNVLFPIRIDDYIFDQWEHERKADVVKKVVGDFRKWEDHDSYQKSLVKLLQDLQSPDPKPAR